MMKLRNLLVIGALIMALLIVAAPTTSARPAQQDTATPEATLMTTESPLMTPAATTESGAPAMEGTSVAPGVSPLGTPSTLPTTGASDDAGRTTTLIVLGIVAVIVIALIGLAVSRRGPETPP